MAENTKMNAILNTQKQLFISDEHIGIQDGPNFSRDKEYVDDQYLKIGVTYSLCKLNHCKFFMKFTVSTKFYNALY